MISHGINSTVPTTVMAHGPSTITERRYIHLFDRQRTPNPEQHCLAPWLATSEPIEPAAKPELAASLAVSVDELWR
jgi:hypothetical protein